MTKKQIQRRKENILYYQRVRARGWAMTSFLMPDALIKEVKDFIKTRSAELAVETKE